MKTRHSESDIEQDKDITLNKIRRNDESEIAYIYKLYREDFIKYAIKNFNLSYSDATEMYQESFVALYQNIKNGKLSSLTSSLRTYLFQIGKYKMLNQNRDNKTDNIAISEIKDLDDTEELTEDWKCKQEITYQVVADMGEPCFTVLSLYYWERKSMAEIASIFNYKSEQIAKNRKSLCLKKLKALLLDKFKSEGLD